MKLRIANLTSNILSPFLVGLVMISLLSFTSASSTLTALKWVLISSVLSILPIFLIVMYLVHNHRLDTFFIKTRAQRTKIYLLATLWGILGCALLIYLKAPTMLVAAYVVGLVMVVIFMCINIWWKISLHTASVSASVTTLVLLYGWTAMATAVLIPLVAWARIELKYHSIAQTVMGALLAAIIVVFVFVRLF